MNEKNKTQSSTALLAIVMILGIALDIVIWRADFFTPTFSVAHEYFLDVGQGDSELATFPHGVKVLNDAGPTDAIVGDLQKILPDGDDYIDLAIIGEPERGDFNGYNFILDHYRVGAFIYNGRNDGSPSVAWNALKQKIQEKDIPLIALGRGDKIHYGGNEIDVLSPNHAFAGSPDADDADLVELIKMPGLRTIFAVGVGANVERWLATEGDDIRADVLKVGNYGSKYLPDDAFLRAVNPAVAFIEPDLESKFDPSASSSPIHPMVSVNALSLSASQNGTVEIYPKNGKLVVIKERGN